MTIEIEIGGVQHAVAVERAGANRYRIVVHRADATGGQAAAVYIVNAVRVGEYGLSLLLEGENNASRELHITSASPSGQSGEFLAGIDGRLVAVTVNGRRTRRTSAEASGSGAGEQSVVAPMPGRVVRVLVGPGDEVQARQPLVVVEAMKMENELRSPRSGTIKEVTVSAGMSVEAGRVLVTVT
jgi:biotin carboxyl carrier protein